MSQTADIISNREGAPCLSFLYSPGFFWKWQVTHSIFAHLAIELEQSEFYLDTCLQQGTDNQSASLCPSGFIDHSRIYPANTVYHQPRSWHWSIVPASLDPVWHEYKIVAVCFIIDYYGPRSWRNPVILTVLGVWLEKNYLAVAHRSSHDSSNQSQAAASLSSYHSWEWSEL